MHLVEWSRLQCPIVTILQGLNVNKCFNTWNLLKQLNFYLWFAFFPLTNVQFPLYLSFWFGSIFPIFFFLSIYDPLQPRQLWHFFFTQSSLSQSNFCIFNFHYLIYCQELSSAIGSFLNIRGHFDTSLSWHLELEVLSGSRSILWTVQTSIDTLIEVNWIAPRKLVKMLIRC